MKHIMFLLMFSYLSFSAISQSNLPNEADTLPLVRVKDWQQKTMIITDEVWNTVIKDQLIKQLGDQKTEEIWRNFDWRSIPSEMSLFDGRKKKDPIQLSKKLDSLKMIRKIALVKFYYNGKDWGNLAILHVPYKGNEMWDEKAKWKNVYIIISESAIEEIKN